MLLAALVVVGAMIRLPTLANESIWFDEAWSWAQSKGSFEELLALTAKENYPPLHNIILFGTIKLLGDAEWALRLPSAVLGLLAIVATYWVGTLLRSRSAGIVAALLVTFSSFHIWYSGEARMYALLAFASTVFVGTGIQFLRRATLLRGGLLVVAGAALVYSHPFGMITWAVMAAVFTTWLFLDARASRGHILAMIGLQLAIAAVLAPWALIMLGRVQAIQGAFWIQRPTLPYVLQQFQTVSSGNFGLLLLGTGFAVYDIVVAREAYGESGGTAVDPRWAIATLLSWAFGPALVALLISLFLQPILLDRYLIGSLPALCILAGIGFTAAARTMKVLAAVLGTVALTAIVSLLSTQQWQRDDLRSVGAYLSSNMAEDDCLAIAVGWMSPPLAYYTRATPSCFQLIDKPEDADRLDRSAAKVFVVLKYAENIQDALESRIKASWAKESKVNFRGADIAVFER